MYKRLTNHAMFNVISYRKFEPHKILLHRNSNLFSVDEFEYVVFNKKFEGWSLQISRRLTYYQIAAQIGVSYNNIFIKNSKSFWNIFMQLINVRSLELSGRVEKLFSSTKWDDLSWRNFLPKIRIAVMHTERTIVCLPLIEKHFAVEPIINCHPFGLITLLISKIDSTRNALQRTTATPSFFAIELITSADWTTTGIF